MTFDEAVSSIPEKWTDWELRTMRRRTRFVFTISRLISEDDEDEVTGFGSTPLEAVEDALKKAEEAG